MANKPLLYSSGKRPRIDHHHYYHTKAESDEKTSFALKFGFKWLFPILWILLNLTLMSGLDKFTILKEHFFLMAAPFIWLLISIYLTFRR